MTSKHALIDRFVHMFFVVFGACIVAVALRLFLVPNDIIDGGVVGISMIVSALTGWSLALLLFVFNVPFLYIAYKQMGSKFAFVSLIGMTAMSVCAGLLSTQKPITDDPLLATVYGGILLGVGVGLVIRYSGAVDGADIVAILISKKTSLSVGEIIMMMNAALMVSAGFVFGWDRAMYSCIAFFIAHKVIDLVVEGFQQSRSVWIVSAHHAQLGVAISSQLGRTVTYFDAEGGYTGTHKRVILCVITRLEEAKLKAIVEQIDAEAFYTIGAVVEVRGKMVGKVRTTTSAL